jgi:hypothetical protein
MARPAVPAARRRASGAPRAPTTRRAAAQQQRASGRRGGRRYAVVYDIDGPRVRLGMLWFVVAAPALVLGPATAALCYGAAATVAAAQTTKVWRQHRRRPSMAVAAGGAAAMSVGAVLGAGGFGLALAGTAVAACIHAAGDDRSNGVFEDAGWTLQCAVPAGLVAASMVLLVRLEVGAAVSLLVLVSVYEIGDFLIGSGASNVYEGPVAGAAAVAVFTFIIAALEVPPFDFASAWAFGLAVALLAPVGQLAASALLPSAASPASGLRRLDSLLLAAPLWAFAVGLLVQSQ